jgi:hypothetical protein
MRTAAALVLIMLGAVALQAADPHPDFSGSWVVESVTSAGDQRDRPEGRPGGFGRGGGGRGFRGAGRGGDGHAGEGRSRGPAADQPRLERGQRVEMTQTDTLLTVIVAPDAGGHVVRYPLDGTDGFTATPDGTALRTRTSWQGVALVTDIRAAEKGRDYHERQLRTMDDGGRVTIETTLETPFGKRSITATLIRRES